MQQLLTNQQVQDQFESAFALPIMAKAILCDYDKYWRFEICDEKGDLLLRKSKFRTDVMKNPTMLQSVTKDIQEQAKVACLAKGYS